MNILGYAPYIQYPIALLILIKFFSFSYNRNNFNLALITLFLGFIGISFGLYQGYFITPRGIIVPFIFLIIVEYKDTSKVKKFLKVILILIFIELFLEYFIFLFYGHSYFISRFNFLRPYGLFIDPHLTGLIFVFILYVLGNKKIGAFFSIIFMSLQTPICYSVLFLKRFMIFTFIFISNNIFSL